MRVKNIFNLKTYSLFARPPTQPMPLQMRQIWTGGRKEERWVERASDSLANSLFIIGVSRPKCSVFHHNEFYINYSCNKWIKRVRFYNVHTVVSWRWWYYYGRRIIYFNIKPTHSHTALTRARINISSEKNWDIKNCYLTCIVIMENYKNALGINGGGCALKYF